jgi:Protein of unknown function (DUF3810)
MVIRRVKLKFPLSAILFALAAATFLASWGNLFPQRVVEDFYARGIFPTISHLFGFMADALPFSWLDVWILAGVAILIYVCLRRRWRLLVGAVSLFYLWFFWGWGLNYHRIPVAVRLHLDPSGLTPSDFSRFGERAAEEINRLWPVASGAPLDRDAISAMAAQRVETVIFRIDGTDWPAARAVKRSLLLEPWYLRAGIDGMFNPFGHEPLVVKGPLPFELPFLMAHEIAHARGIANEGEANLIALLATVGSDDPRFQYSGWLHLWGYLANPSKRLDPGPQADLRAVVERMLLHHVPAIDRVQSALLDAHLKANAVPGGIRSYSDFVALAIASEPRWKEFR